MGPAAPVDELNFPGASDARPNLRKDGLEIVFDSTRAGGTKIYAATRSSVLGSWSAPVPLDSAVNIATSQTRPSISRDGQRLYFGSNAANQTGDTGADIFVSTRSGPGEGQDK
jgi:Tol biopolymer transport system component